MVGFELLGVDTSGTESEALAGFGACLGALMTLLLLSIGLASCSSIVDLFNRLMVDYRLPKLSARMVNFMDKVHKVV